MAQKTTQAEFTKWFGPLLDALRTLGDSGTPKEVSQTIADALSLSDEILEQTVPSGGNRFHNQVCWARQYLVWEGLVESLKHGTWKLTPKGKATHLSEDQAKQIYLKWVEIHQKAKKTKDEAANAGVLDATPDDAELDGTAETDLLSVLQNVSPSGFERLCKELLREHGFENVVVTGKSHDEGIDGYGTLELNPFVSFKVLFQCKRYKASVSRAQVGDFRNAMIGRAEKGIIITTGTFSNEAVKESAREGAPPVELVDGAKLVAMFQKVELGLKPRTVYEVDMNYFEPFMKE